MRQPVALLRSVGTAWIATLMTGCLHAPGAAPSTPPKLPETQAAPPALLPTAAAPVLSNYNVQTAPPKTPPDAPVQTVSIAPARTAPPPAPAANAAPVPVAQAPPVDVVKTPPDPPLLDALRSILDKKPAAVAALSLLDPAVRDLVMTLLTLAVQTYDNNLDKTAPRDAETWLGQLRHLSAALRGRAPLVLNKLCFCSEIDGFGKYDAMPGDHGFQSGEPMQVYVEVRNFLSRCLNTPRGPIHEINMPSTLEILDFRREIVYHEDFPVKECSLTPHQDFYINYRFLIPPKTPPGSYTLRLTVRDAALSPGGIARVAWQTLDFRVVSH